MDDLWVVRMKPDHQGPSVFLKTPYRELAAVFSPDGRCIVYMSNEAGRMEVYVRPFVDVTSPGVSRVGGQWQISSGGGVYPRWRREGKELYFLNLAGDMMAAKVALNAATLEAGAPVTLFQERVFADGTPDNVDDVTADGRFLVNTVIDRGLAPITLLMNWSVGNVNGLFLQPSALEPYRQGDLLELLIATGPERRLLDLERCNDGSDRGRRPACQVARLHVSKRILSCGAFSRSLRDRSHERLVRSGIRGGQLQLDETVRRDRID